MKRFWMPLGILVTISVGFSAYWFQIRPSMIKASCQKEVDELVGPYLWQQYGIFKNDHGAWVTSDYNYLTEKREQTPADQNAVAYGIKYAENSYTPCLHRHGE